MTDVVDGAPAPGSPMTDWATDFDHTAPEYNERAHEIWDHLRSHCPVAHSDRFGGTWLPTRHEDVAAIARDTEHFTSQGVVVSPVRPGPEDLPRPIGPAPPITSDPPFHAEARRILLPPFGPKAIEELIPKTRSICRELIADLPIDEGRVDVATHYTQHIPVRVIAHMLGIPETDGDVFRRAIYHILENPGSGLDLPEEETFEHYLDQRIAEHIAEPRDDLISYLLDVELMGQKLAPEHVRGTVLLLVVAGIDTTWSAIGSSIHHLATHPHDLVRLQEDPGLWDTAIEELLRAYAPVTMARLVAEDTEIGGCPVKQDDWVLLPFPAANRDPEVFDRADEVVLDRARNRHATFGLGIHRCLGSNLARMELRIALEELVAAFPRFRLDDSVTMRWSTGQVRGPRELPLVLG